MTRWTIRPLSARVTAALLGLAGLLPVLPLLLRGNPVLNNDMLWAYFSYFHDFHRNFSLAHPLVLWSGSYQCGMPMHAYWQSGFLYPVTWILFGPVSPHVGIHLFYAFHFALAAVGWLALGPRLLLGRAASAWAGLVFGLSGTLLARYEHPTFLAGWAWLPLVLAAFLRLRDRPGAGPLLLYGAAVALQAFGGHPQASFASALLIGLFTAGSLLFPGRVAEGLPSPSGARLRSARRLLGGHLLALAFCAPLLVPFLQLVETTNRHGGAAWVRGGNPEGGAAEKLVDGVFGFQEFSTGGLRPLHLLSLAAPHALGTPTDASWWGGEVWGEVFVYGGGAALFLCAFASFRRGGRDLKLLLLAGLVGLWLAAGAHLGASQILYHVPVVNNFRFPARSAVLFALAFAALSAHGFQRWAARPHGERPAAALLGSAAVALLLLATLARLPGLQAALFDLIRPAFVLDPAKDYAAKLAALVAWWAQDAGALALAGGVLLWGPRRARAGGRGRREALLGALFAVLLLDLLRLHWERFYPFPPAFYREPPATVALLDTATAPFWRVESRLFYRDHELWRLHNHPLSAPHLLQREKDALNHGIHAVFGFRHAGAYLPLLWKWKPATTAEGKSTRYLLTNGEPRRTPGDSLRLLGGAGEVKVYERMGWRPRLERVPAPGGAPGAAVPPAGPGAGPGACPAGYAGWGGICVRQVHDGRLLVKGPFRAGDSLLFRERAHGGWRYRLDGGAWRPAAETVEHFLVAPLDAAAETVEFAFYPRHFYRFTALAFLLALLVPLPYLFRRLRNSRGIAASP